MQESVRALRVKLDKSLQALCLKVVKVELRFGQVYKLSKDLDKFIS